MKAKLLLLFSLVLMLSGVSALPHADFAMTGIECTYSRACIDVSWDAAVDHATTDFNWYVLGSTSLTSDINTNALTYTLCDIDPDVVTTVTVTRWDSNAGEMFTNLLPETCTVSLGGMVGGGQYLVYNTLVAIGTVILLIVLVAVIVLIMDRMKIVDLKTMFKK